MPLNPQETVSFTTVPTPVVGERAGVLRVPESYFKASTTVTRGTTLAAFLPGVDKSSALNRGFGSYTLTEPADAPDGYLGFYFNKPKTDEQAGTAIRSYYEVEPSYWWPPVLTELLWYRQDDGTYTFKPVLKESFDGPTRVLVEEFFSPNAFNITAPTIMRPLAFDDVLRVVGSTTDFSIGRVVLPRCLRPSVSLTLALSPSVTEGALTYTQASLYISATNVTDWPASLVIDDRQRQVSGGYLRRKVTAYKPL